MLNITNLRLVSLALIPASLLFSIPAIAAKNDVLVVPDRQRMVNLAFDLQALRGLVLVTYRGNASSTTPLLHVWDSHDNTWRRVSPEDFAFGRFMLSQPNTIYLIGADSDLPPSVIEGASQASKLIRVNTLNTAEAANIFNETMKFSEREWQALAERHGLETRDLNYERRKWGRFGPPGTHYAPPPAPSTAVASEEPLAVNGDIVNPAELDSEVVEVIEIPTEKAYPTPEAQPTIILDASTQQSLDPDDISEAKPEPIAVQDIATPPPAADMLPEDK